MNETKAISRDVYYNIRTSHVVEAFHDILGKTVVEMIESGNIKEAVRSLGGDDSNQDIPSLMRRRAQYEVNEAELKVQSYIGRQKVEWSKNLEERKRKLEMIEKRIVELNMGECVICSEKKDKAVVMECCQNSACGSCLLKWVNEKRTCPFCRKNDPKLLYAGGEEKEEKKEMSFGKNTKFFHLQNIIRNGEKVLVFSSFDNQFKEIKEMFGDVCELLTGSVTHRQNILQRYWSGDLKVLLLDSRLNGAGLNLQNTTDVVLWNFMPKHLVTQVVGRAVRYGCDHEVVVHKFYKKAMEDFHHEDDKTYKYK